MMTSDDNGSGRFGIVFVLTVIVMTRSISVALVATTGWMVGLAIFHSLWTVTQGIVQHCKRKPQIDQDFYVKTMVTDERQKRIWRKFRSDWADGVFLNCDWWTKERMYNPILPSRMEGAGGLQVQQCVYSNKGYIGGKTKTDSALHNSGDTRLQGWWNVKLPASKVEKDKTPLPVSKRILFTCGKLSIFFIRCQK